MSLLSLGKATTGCHRERRRNRMEMRPESANLKRETALQRIHSHFLYIGPVPARTGRLNCYRNR